MCCGCIRVADVASACAVDITVEPTPAECRAQMDRFGNRATLMNFVGSSDLLRIESRFELDTLSPAPLRDPGLPRLPWPANPQDGMSEYRADGTRDAAVQAFADRIASDCGWTALQFLKSLNQTLFACMDRFIRVEGAARRRPTRLPSAAVLAAT